MGLLLRKNVDEHKASFTWKCKKDEVPFYWKRNVIWTQARKNKPNFPNLSPASGVEYPNIASQQGFGEGKFGICLGFRKKGKLNLLNFGRILDMTGLYCFQRLLNILQHLLRVLSASARIKH